MSLSGEVKKWFEDKGFGFITPDDGGEDAFIHCNDLNDKEAGLQPGDKVSYDSEYDDRKGKYKASNCKVTKSGGGGGGGGGGYGGKGGGGGYSPYGGGKGKW